ncbi:MAG: hypothetical protein ACRD1S_09415 [Vicinamibacterales bacterium]
MNNLDFCPRSAAPQRHAHAEALLSQRFKNAGWRVVRQPVGPQGHRADLLVRRPGASYIVEVKAGAEGRSDRLIPLWAQGRLQAARLAGAHAPLAVVAAPKIAPRVAEHILKFAEQYAPDAAAGVIDFAGLGLFRGPHLDSLNADVPPERPSRAPREQAHLFSDLNQWMLKVLLAPELPDALLAAPRGRYRNASQLARAAHVSVMSAFRFVQQLQREGYLHESDAYLNVVRRDDLFRRWQASALRSVNEAPMRLLLRGGDSRAALRRMLDSGRACLALFAAADGLGFGYVQGVPPYVYVRRLGPASLSAWKNLVPVAPGEPPDVIVRQAPAPQAVFRGVVRPHGLASCDILQVWVDVSAHPARGQEQADLIRTRVLERLVRGSSRG